MIQRQAVRLFLEHGYDATTVEQVAAAAEVAPSTVFRYFPTKEDLAISDDFDPLLIEAFRLQPADLTPMRALRAAIRSALGGLSPEELAMQRERTALVLSVPALRGVTLGNLVDTVRMLSELIAERVGRAPDDPAVRAFIGAVFGVMTEVMLRWCHDPETDVITDLDDALALLEAGLPLG